MDTVTILEQAKELGLSLSIDGDKLNVTGPKTPAAAALVAQMAQQKAAVIAYLTQPDPSPTADDLAFTLADVDALPIEALPPMTIITNKPPLPADQWLNGVTPVDALAAHRRLKADYFCSCGADGDGWFVRCEESKYRLVAP